MIRKGIQLRGHVYITSSMGTAGVRSLCKLHFKSVYRYSLTHEQYMVSSLKLRGEAPRSARCRKVHVLMQSCSSSVVRLQQLSLRVKVSVAIEALSGYAVCFLLF